MKRATVFVHNKDLIVPEGAVEAHFDDLYVNASVLEEWFDIRISTDISVLRLFITKNTPFPFEQGITCILELQL